MPKLFALFVICTYVVFVFFTTSGATRLVNVKYLDFHLQRVARTASGVASLAVMVRGATKVNSEDVLPSKPVHPHLWEYYRQENPDAFSV